MVGMALDYIMVEMALDCYVMVGMALDYHYSSLCYHRNGLEYYDMALDYVIIGMALDYVMIEFAVDYIYYDRNVSRLGQSILYHTIKTVFAFVFCSNSQSYI